MTVSLLLQESGSYLLPDGVEGHLLLDEAPAPVPAEGGGDGGHVWVDVLPHRPRRVGRKLQPVRSRETYAAEYALLLALLLADE